MLTNKNLSYFFYYLLDIAILLASMCETNIVNKNVRILRYEIMKRK